MTEAEQANLKAFAKAVLKVSGYLDGGDVDALALTHGLLVEVVYDPEKHGEVDWDAEPGDTINVLSDWMKGD